MLGGATVLALVVVVGLVYVIHTVETQVGASDSPDRGVSAGDVGRTNRAQGTLRRDEIAARPMLSAPDNASQPTDASSTKPGSLEVPAGTGVTGPALVATGFPHTPEGAIGQLAQIDIAVLSSMSPQTAREVYVARSLPGGVAAQGWWTAVTVDSFLSSSGMGEALTPDAAISVEPAAALVKGVEVPPGP